MFGRKELVRRTEPGPLAVWNPLEEIDGFRKAMDSLLEDFFAGDGGDLQAQRRWLPALDVEERDRDYLLSVEVPGMEKEDVRVEIQGNNLIIRGERKERKDEKHRGFLRHEQYHGVFRRSLLLPDDAVAEGLKATYKNGILSVVVPRSEKAKGKSVPVTVE